MGKASCWTTWCAVAVAAAVMLTAPALPSAAAQTPAVPSGDALTAGTEPLGSGDGRIHVIPALSAPSVKNGGVLTIQAVVTSQHPVARVEARIQREGGVSGLVATLDLRPAPGNLGAVNSEGTVGLWQAKWTAAGLEEATYAVTLTVRDATGHAFSDRSLRFTDPIAGRDVVGSTSYPDGGMRRLDAEVLRNERILYCAVIDTANGYAYFGTLTSRGQVVKVALGSGSNPPSRVGAVALAYGEDYLRSAVIDPAAGYAYFGTQTSPGRVVKVALGSGSNPPTRVGASRDERSLK